MATAPTEIPSTSGVAPPQYQLGPNHSFLVVGLAGAASFLTAYFRMFVFPDTPILFWGDALLYATNGFRMAAGQLPYRDYFVYLTPGSDIIYALLFRLFEVFLWIPNFVMVVLATISAVLMTRIGQRLMRGWAALLPGLLFAGFVLYGSLDANHHWFSTVAILAAVLVLIDGNSLLRVA